MDPNVTLQLFIDNDPGAASNLNRWFDKGGFAPRIEIHPGMDAWMQGDRFGSVVRVGHKHLHVKMDRSGRILKVAPDRVHKIL